MSSTVISLFIRIILCLLAGIYFIDSETLFHDIVNIALVDLLIRSMAHQTAILVLRDCFLSLRHFWLKTELLPLFLLTPLALLFEFELMARCILI